MSRTYPDRPIVGVGAVVWRNDQFLLIQRSKPPRPGSWSLPGGGQEVGETVFEAAKREVAEETGVAIDVLGLVDVVDNITRDADRRVEYHYTLVDVVAEWIEGEPRAQGDAAGVRWARLDELGQFNLWEQTIRVIRLAGKQRVRLRRRLRSA